MSTKLLYFHSTLCSITYATVCYCRLLFDTVPPRLLDSAPSGLFILSNLPFNTACSIGKITSTDQEEIQTCWAGDFYPAVFPFLAHVYHTKCLILPMNVYNDQDTCVLLVVSVIPYLKYPIPSLFYVSSFIRPPFSPVIFQYRIKNADLFVTHPLNAPHYIFANRPPLSQLV